MSKSYQNKKKVSWSKYFEAILKNSSAIILGVIGLCRGILVVWKFDNTIYENIEWKNVILMNPVDNVDHPLAGWMQYYHNHLQCIVH